MNAEKVCRESDWHAICLGCLGMTLSHFRNFSYNRVCLDSKETGLPAMNS